MLISKDFIVINNPKTGSSFVRECLKEIFKQKREQYPWLKKKSIDLGLLQPELKELMMPTVEPSNIPPNQHGAVSQIPKKYSANKEIVSVIRNPYTRFLSQYEFRWWAENYSLFVDTSLVINTFPHFPNLSLDEFIDFTIIADDHKYPNISKKKVGHQTIRFIEIFFNRPLEVIANINDDYIFSGAYKQDLKPITFLQQENLTEELVAFLSQYNFTQEELDIIRNHQRVNVTKSQHANRNSLHTPKSLEYIKTYERLLFKMYEDLGIIYKLP